MAELHVLEGLFLINIILLHEFSHNKTVKVMPTLMNSAPASRANPTFVGKKMSGADSSKESQTYPCKCQ